MMGVESSSSCLQNLVSQPMASIVAFMHACIYDHACIINTCMHACRERHDHRLRQDRHADPESHDGVLRVGRGAPGGQSVLCKMQRTVREFHIFFHLAQNSFSLFLSIPKLYIPKDGQNVLMFHRSPFLKTALMRNFILKRKCPWKDISFFSFIPNFIWNTT